MGASLAVKSEYVRDREYVDVASSSTDVDVNRPAIMLVHHIFSGERLQVFSDAVFAIIATIMVCLTWF